MKQPKKPTREQKEVMTKHNLAPDNWQVVFESRNTLEVISKRSKRRRTLKK